jgi:nucleotidyltransferase substrate binding protein (TIGR01987 family)
MNIKDIRWEQRLNNYLKALSQLELFIKKDQLNQLEEQGLIKSFEYTYELAWQTIKDYLQFQGYQDIKGSRDAIQQAFPAGNNRKWRSLDGYV